MCNRRVDFGHFKPSLLNDFNSNSIQLEFLQLSQVNLCSWVIYHLNLSLYNSQSALPIQGSTYINHNLPKPSPWFLSTAYQGLTVIILRNCDLL